jgi:hypothetical protein
MNVVFTLALLRLDDGRAPPPVVVVEDRYMDVILHAYVT